MRKAIRIHPKDNVAVAITSLNAFDTVEIDDLSIVLKDNIPAGHKFCVHTIEQGENVVKYGSVIGLACSHIAVGSWVHVHNVRTGLDREVEYSYAQAEGDQAVEDSYSSAEADDSEESLKQKTFMGYLRKNGNVGIRNEVWIIPTVGCVNGIAQELAKQANQRLPQGIDKVVAFPHPYGCSQMGDDQENTRIILADLIQHPNAGAILVLGLGCENSHIEILKQYIHEPDEKRIKYLVCQDCEDEISEGNRVLDELMRYASSFQRSTCGIEHLKVGLKCGGSDGFSGITANPVVGRFSDIFVQLGGTTILTEVPEMFGAEKLLMKRCVNREVFDKTVQLIHEYKNYFMSHGQTVYENPSPGNKAGGITTLEDKALGCTQKSGTSLIMDVLSYGDRLQKTGLHLLSAPGNDLVAATALAATGAQIVLFTTGRGTPFGTAVPTIKIASNPSLANKKQKWIDYNAGEMINGKSLADAGMELFELVLQVAEGQTVSSERAGYQEIAIFKNGVTL